MLDNANVVAKRAKATLGKTNEEEELNPSPMIKDDHGQG